VYIAGYAFLLVCDTSFRTSISQRFQVKICKNFSGIRPHVEHQSRTSATFQQLVKVDREALFASSTFHNSDAPPMTTFNNTTVQVLTDSLSGAGVQAHHITQWWEAESVPGETISDFLIRNKILMSGATATIRMIQRGYAKLDPKMLLVDGAIERLKQYRNQAQCDVMQNATNPITVVTEASMEDTIHIAEKPNRVGQTVGRCMLTRLVGSGGGGSVYEALHLGLGITVAVKMLAEKQVKPEVRKALRDEARLLAQLNHPNIVRIYDFCDDGPEPFLVMEMVNGSSLSELISQSGYLKAERAAALLVQAVRGLDAAWQIGIVHRDVKPANLLITRQGQLKIADLGLAWFHNPNLGSGAGFQYGGTLAYMAPERFGDKIAPDIQADMYSLGVTLYEAMTGKPPFDGKTALELMIQHNQDPVPDPRKVNPLIGAELVEILMKLMAKNPLCRYGDYLELLEHLSHYFQLLPNQDETLTWNPFIHANTLRSSGGLLTSNYPSSRGL
jgi:tRNA A-37 threonylcarbamoyl transferase component Bud32